MSVESYGENNLTATIATASVPMERRGVNHYWLGLASLDDLRTNTLESAAGTLFSQYSGELKRNLFQFLTVTFSIDFSDLLRAPNTIITTIF